MVLEKNNVATQWSIFEHNDKKHAQQLFLIFVKHWSKENYMVIINKTIFICYPINSTKYRIDWDNLHNKYELKGSISRCFNFFLCYYEYENILKAYPWVKLCSTLLMGHVNIFLSHILWIWIKLTNSQIHQQQVRLTFPHHWSFLIMAKQLQKSN